VTSATGQSERAGARPRSRRGEGARLRAELVAAAGALLAEAGSADQVSLRRVADTVGVTAPSIYRHFPNKEALLLAVVAERFAELRQMLLDAAERAGPDPFAALREAGLAYVGLGHDHPGHYRVMFGPIGGAIFAAALPSAPGDGRFAVGDPGQEAFLALVSLIERCLAAGSGGHRFDPFEVAVQTWTFVHGLVDLSTTHPGFPWPALDAVIDGYVERLRAAVMLGDG
jgi:AcrR family transcriptional regulator